MPPKKAVKSLKPPKTSKPPVSKPILKPAPREPIKVLATPVEEAPVPVEVAPEPEPIVPAQRPAFQRPDLTALRRKAAQLQGKDPEEEQTLARPNGKRPPDPDATEFIVHLDDGTSLYAEGENAKVIFRFIQECQRICVNEQMALYNGPGFARMATADLEAIRRAAASPVPRGVAF